jgi:hypothetical protein
VRSLADFGFDHGLPLKAAKFRPGRWHIEGSETNSSENRGRDTSWYQSPAQSEFKPGESSCGQIVSSANVGDVSIINPNVVGAVQDGVYDRG